VTAKTGVTCIAVSSEGFRGTKKDGYSAAVNALDQLVGTGNTKGITERSINLLGDFNVAGESWLMRQYFEKMGLQVVSVITGDGRVDDIRRAHGAKLNLVQCSGSTTGLAMKMQEKYKIPFIKVSFFGLEDTSSALYDTARFWNDADLMKVTKNLVYSEMERVLPQLRAYKRALQGRKAALYVGGAFKAFSLVTALRQLGMKVVLAGTQTGGKAEYEQLQRTCDEGTVIVDDTNPSELAHFLKGQDVDLFIGGVKERPIAYKLGIGFCDHNHERKIGLAGFEGMLAFAKEVHATVMSPVWQFTPRRANRGGC
jgi:nitrogenase molybdenum-cofactor synthesis protein NifE